MNKWEVAIEKFLESYIKKEYFLGAILTGSYATGFVKKKTTSIGKFFAKLKIL